MFKNLTTKQLVIKIVCFAVMVIVMVALIVGDSFAWKYSLNVDALLGVTKTDFSNAAEELQASDKLGTEIEEDSIVLFKNREVNGKPALPLDSSVQKLNVFGYGATGYSANALKGFLLKGVGSGSSTINPNNALTLIQGLEGYVRNFDLESQYENAADITTAVKAAWGAEHLVSYEVNHAILDKYDSLSSSSVRPGAPGSGNVYNLNEPDTSVFNDVISEAKQFSDVAIFVISRDGGENVGEIPDNYLEITTQERNTLKYLHANFGKIIVLLNTTNTMHLGFLNEDELGIDACLYVGLTGQSGARAIPEILAGKKYVEVETENESGEATTKVEEVQFSPSGRFTDIVTKSNAVVRKFDPTWVNRAPGSNGISYVDDIYYGYKWYETADADSFVTAGGELFNYDDIVAYPFGYGLSYTTFSKKITSVTYGEKNTKLNDNAEFDNVGVGETITVTVEVENIGKTHAGSEVVQLYYTPEYKQTIEKAEINLLDFGKTGILKPGDKETVTLSFTPYDMASYDCYDKNNNSFWGYELESGKYELKLMDDSHTLIQKHTLKLKNDIQIDKDPVTGNAVVNRFTGNINDPSYNGSSYAGLGTDGAEAGVSRDQWLTRADFTNTFPTAIAKGASGSKVKTANEWMVDTELGASLPEFSSSNIADSNLRLVKVATYAKPIAELEEGAVPVSVEAATKDQLDGNLRNDQKFEYDWDLIEKLAKDYNEETNPLWTQILNQMSLADMKQVIELGGFRRLPIVSVGKPHQNDVDGPAGFNTASITGNWSGTSDSSKWTAFESEALIGCCWNKGLMLAMGLSMGAEGSATNVAGWYAPGVNLHRSNYTARNYEYYSEDAVLSGKLAAYVIAGAKINNLNCYLKHFVCSEEGPNPGGVNTWITEQNLRENYLRPFEIAVKEGGANSIMTAFNNVGASWAGANYAMNQKVLREEWGFNGTLITDWSNGGALGGMYSRQGVRAGNDLWLNNGTSLGNPLESAKDAKYIRNSLHNILFTFVDTVNTYHQYQSGNVELEADSELSVLLAKYGMGELSNVGGGSGYSWWKAVLIVIDVLVGLGFIVWALFLTGVAQKLIAKIKKTPATEAVTAEGEAVPEGGSAPDAATTPEGETIPEAPAEEITPAEEAPQAEPENKDEN